MESTKSTSHYGLEQYSPREERANVLTHGAGLALSVAGFAALVVVAVARGEGRGIASALVYGAALVALYATSTLYHSSRSPKLKRKLRVADHCSIFVFIAGTYTPFTLVSLKDSAWGWTLFAVIWSVAAAGVALKLFFTGRYKLLSTLVYVAMGWLAIIAIKPFTENVQTAGLLWILAGGVAYSGGSALYLWKRLPFNHALWHLCVLGGSACHFVAIFFYVLLA